MRHIETLMSFDTPFDTLLYVSSMIHYFILSNDYNHLLSNLLCFAALALNLLSIKASL